MDDQWHRRYGPRSEWDDPTDQNVPRPRALDNQSPEPSPRYVPGGSEMILVVEDQPDVLEAIATILRRLGYRVGTAVDLDSALVAASDIDHLELLLTDVVLPNQNGLAVAERVRDIHPETRVLYMSAFTSDVVVAVDDEVNGNFLAKPFTLEEIARKIRSILDSDRGGQKP